MSATELIKLIEKMGEKERLELAQAIEETVTLKCGHDGYCHCQCGLHKENGDY